MLTIVALDQQENFMQFLDPDLCTLEETIEYGGLRTLDFKYQFQDLSKDKRLFKKGINFGLVETKASLIVCM